MTVTTSYHTKQAPGFNSPDHFHVSLPGRPAASHQQLCLSKVLGETQQVSQVLRDVRALPVRVRLGLDLLRSDKKK